MDTNPARIFRRREKGLFPDGIRTRLMQPPSLLILMITVPNQTYMQPFREPPPPQQLGPTYPHRV